jgi:hypothetical protein
MWRARASRRLGPPTPAKRGAPVPDWIAAVTPARRMSDAHVVLRAGRAGRVRYRAAFRALLGRSGCGLGRCAHSRPALQDPNLVTEGQDLQLERRAGSPDRTQGGQERRNDRQHWREGLSQSWSKSNDLQRSRFPVGTGMGKSTRRATRGSKRAHWGAIAGADFFTTEVWTWRGLVTFYTVFVIHWPRIAYTSSARRRIPMRGSCAKSRVRPRWRTTVCSATATC